MALGKFEQLCKMTRLGPEPLSTLSGPPPVKFRPVFYNPHLIEEDDNLSSSQSDEFDMDEEILHADLPFNGKHFHKDPLNPSFNKTDESSEVEENSEDSSKLGHNMRACAIKKSSNADKTVWGQMEARKQLLEEQKEQHMTYAKRDTTDREATALVNNLLQQGFHIIPPESTPRFTEASMAASQDVTDPQFSIIKQETEFLKSIHNELKRVQGDSTSSQTVLL